MKNKFTISIILIVDFSLMNVLATVISKQVGILFTCIYTISMYYINIYTHTNIILFC